MEEYNEILEEPVEGMAPPPPEFMMEGPNEIYFTSPSSPSKEFPMFSVNCVTTDEEITKMFDDLCDKEQNDATDMVGEIWSQDQFTESELLWTLALEDVPSPTIDEEAALLEFGSLCLNEDI